MSQAIDCIAPMLPVLSAGALFGSKPVQSHAITQLAHVEPTASGTAAIALALAHCGATRGSDVLLPAYQCESMIEPARWVGATPRFYRLSDDLQCDVPHLRTCIGEHTAAVIVPHYFGRVCDLSAVRAVCDERGVSLIEDCAHAFFGVADRPVGEAGDYAIASLPKFFPVTDGGLLASARRTLADIAIEANTGAFELQAAWNIVDEACEYGRLAGLRPAVALARAVRRFARRGRNPPSPSDAERDAPGIDADGAPYEFLDTTRVHRRASRGARWLLQRASWPRIIANRQRNYEHMARELARLPGCRLMFPQLAEHAVPYVVPLLIEDEGVYAELRRARAPVWRWDGTQSATCEVSARYARHLIQLPCHQELEPREIERILHAVGMAVRGR